jgi:hypothetical protein
VRAVIERSASWDLGIVTGRMHATPELSIPGRNYRQSQPHLLGTIQKSVQTAISSTPQNRSSFSPNTLASHIRHDQIALPRFDYFGLINNDFVRIPENVSTVVDLFETKGITWIGYFEGLPEPGYMGARSTGSDGGWDYVRKHK